MPEEIKIKLMQQYLPQVRQVSDLIDIDLVTKWRYDTLVAESSLIKV
jgi:hypothetical protein